MTRYDSPKDRYLHPPSHVELSYWVGLWNKTWHSLYSDWYSAWNSIGLLMSNSIKKKMLLNSLQEQTFNFIRFKNSLPKVKVINRLPLGISIGLLAWLQQPLNEKPSYYQDSSQYGEKSRWGQERLVLTVELSRLLTYECNWLDIKHSIGHPFVLFLEISMIILPKASGFSVSSCGKISRSCV